MKITYLLSGIVAALLVVSCGVIDNSNNKTSGKALNTAYHSLTGTNYFSFDDKGNLLRPKDYRSWIFAGSVTTPKSFDETVLFPDFQNVYIDPISYEYWKKMVSSGMVLFWSKSFYIKAM